MRRCSGENHGGVLQVICPVCEGFGVDPDTVTENLKGEPCRLCGGSGDLPVKGPRKKKDLIDELVDNGLGRDDIERRRAS